MWRVTHVEPRGLLRLYVRFEDGVEGEIDLSGKLRGPMAEPLKDDAYFRKVGLDEFGVVCWPNGFDLAPDAMHDRLAGLGSGAEAVR